MKYRMQKSHEYVNIGLGALAAQTAVLRATKIDASREQGCRLKKVKGSFSWRAKTASEGPVLFGLCTGLTAAEVAEAVLADPQLVDDPGAGEMGNRKVFPVGVIPSISTQTSQNADPLGSLLTNLRVPSWIIDEGKALNIFAMNLHAAAALTTGTYLDFVGVILATWERD